MDDDLLAPVELDRPEAGAAIAPGTMPAAAQRELERARRAEAARVAALVQYMLHGRADAPRNDVTRR
jgi:hypothetical protein